MRTKRDLSVNMRLETADFEKAAAQLLRLTRELAGQMRRQLYGPEAQGLALQGALQGLRDSLQALGAAAAGAVQPLLLALVPVLDAVVGAATGAMQALAALTQWLFGGAYGLERAGEGATAYAGGLKKLGGAAKRTKKDLAGFDQLDVLLGPEVAGGGGSGGVSVPGGEEGWTVFSTLLDGIRAKLAEVVAYIHRYFAPALEAWGRAFGEVKRAVLACVGTVRGALEGLWNQSLAPLLHYLLTDFVPAVVNAFARTFAPIFSDVVCAAVEEFGRTFAFVCEMAARVVADVLMPALEFVKGAFVDVMRSIEEMWQTYGARIVEGFAALCQKLRELALQVYEQVVRPLVQMVGAALSELWEEHLQPLWERLVLFVGALAECVLNFWNEVLLPFVSWFVEVFGPFITQVLEGVVGVFKTGIGAMSDLLAGFLAALRGLLEFLSGVFTGDWQRAWEGLAAIVEGVWTGICDFIKGIVNAILAIINGMMSGVTAGVNAVISAINSISVSIPDWVPGLGGKSIGFNLPSVSAPQIPYLARGAVIPPNREFLAVLGDQRQGTNIEAPEALLRQLLREELGERQERDINIRFTGSLSQLARVLRPEIEKESRRTGVQLVSGAKG